MRWPTVNSKVFALALGIVSCTLSAEQESTPGAWVEVGAMGIAAASASDDPPTPGLLVFDVAVGVQSGHGHFSMVVEAESCPPVSAGLAAPPGGIYGDWAAHGDGEAQLMEMRYHFASDIGEWSIGFIESKGYLDSSAIANDDKTQFASPVFVNNPTIDLPDSNLGLSWQRASASANRGYSAVLAGNEGPGAFMAVESWWDMRTLVARLGAWRNGSRFTQITGAKTEYGQGLYATIDGTLAEILWNVRAGVARPAHRERMRFFSAAAEIPLAGNSLGIAVGHSSEGAAILPGAPGGASHVELYYRWQLTEELVVSPSLQFIGVTSSGDSETALTAGIRFRMVI